MLQQTHIFQRTHLQIETKEENKNLDDAKERVQTIKTSWSIE